MMPQQNLRFALAVLGVIAVLCVFVGGYLLLKGYQSGELFVGVVSSIAGAIAGMLSMRAHPPDGTMAPSAGGEDKRQDAASTGVLTPPLPITNQNQNQPPPPTP